MAKFFLFRPHEHRHLSFHLGNIKNLENILCGNLENLPQDIQEQISSKNWGVYHFHHWERKWNVG